MIIDTRTPISVDNIDIPSLTNVSLINMESLVIYDL